MIPPTQHAQQGGAASESEGVRAGRGSGSSSTRVVRPPAQLQPSPSTGTGAARRRHAPPGTRPRDVYKFGDPAEVEIVARVARSWVDEDTLDAEAGRLAEAVLKVGGRWGKGGGGGGGAGALSLLSPVLRTKLLVGARPAKRPPLPPVCRSRACSASQPTPS
jgi:hypothetical protein